MVELTVVPIEYSTERLDAVIGSISGAYSGIFDSVRITDSLRIGDLPGGVVYREQFWHTALSDPLLGFLDQFGQSVLAVTSLQVIDAGPLVALSEHMARALGVSYIHEYVHRFLGHADPYKGTAYVSTSKVAMGLDQSDVQMDRVSALSVHEAGHFFGLSHHEHRPPIAGEGYCAMSIDNAAQYRRNCLSLKIHRLQPSFCEPCYQTLEQRAAPVLALGTN